MRVISGRDASCRATSLPIPPLAPVTIAVLPEPAAMVDLPWFQKVGCSTHFGGSKTGLSNSETLGWRHDRHDEHATAAHRERGTRPNADRGSSGHVDPR